MLLGYVQAVTVCMKSRGLGGTAVEVGVPRLRNCLEMYACAQASAKFVHSMCTSLNTPCTLEVYTCLGTGLGTCVHFQAVFKIWHSNFYSSWGGHK